MYCPFSYMGINQLLPSTAYIKMIDAWMIFTMLCPFFEILLAWLKDLFKGDTVLSKGGFLS